MFKKRLLLAALMPCAFSGCADLAAAMQPQSQRVMFTDAQFADAVRYCKSTVSKSSAGSCIETQLSEVNPNWTSHPNAIYASMLFSYINAVGTKIDNGSWSEERGKYELNNFVNRLKIQMAERDRINRQMANQAANQAAFQAGFNAFSRSTTASTGITCIRFGNMVQCN